MRRLLASAALAAAALTTSPAAALEDCTPTPAGVCVRVVCLKLCVFQAEIDPYCHLEEPAPPPVAAACARIDAKYVQIGG